MPAVSLLIQVNILEKIKHTQSSLGGYQPKVGLNRGIVWSQDTNHTDLYKARPTPNMYPTSHPNSTRPILMPNQTRATSTKSELIVGIIT